MKSQLVTSSGYPIELHRAVTSDGYILQLHRIPSGRRTVRKTGPSLKGKKVVLIGHGLLGSSGDFVLMGPGKSIGKEFNTRALALFNVPVYFLADEGYDVWLANFRGNIYTSHETYTRADRRFWEYSFHEHGTLDLPACIDKVLNVTGLQKLLYVGYSMGTTTAFIMLSERPEYNDKLLSYVALAPAVYLTNIKLFAEWTLKEFPILEYLRSVGVLAIDINPEALYLLVQAWCSVREVRLNVCMRVVYRFVGNDEEQYDPDIMPLAIARMQPASFRQLEHFGKIAMTDEFTAWEDGLFGSVRAYNLDNVKTPVTLMYCENDKLTEKKQIYRLARKLNSTGVLEAIQPIGDWFKLNHLDVVFAKDLGTMVSQHIMKHIGYIFSKNG
ncbi:unnamed protein product, partial [Brenthis ino]